jgi:hypothetical protein
VSNPIRQYFRRHGRYPRKTIACGKRDQLIVTITPRYAIISTALHARSIYVPRSAFVELIRFGAKVGKHMDPQDHDVEQAMHLAIREEEKLNREMRQFKKTLYGRPRRKRR